MRLALLLTTLSVSLAACGTECDAVVSAQQGVNQRGQSCNSSTLSFDGNKCNNNLSKCSPDDLKAVDTYVQCLNNVGVCSSSTSLSWGLSVLGCSQPLGGVSFACSSATGL